MTGNELLLAELNKFLDNIKNKIKAKKISLYEDELNELGRIIQFALKSSHHSPFFEKNDMVKSIMKIINKINKEITSIEIEMHGVGNYSRYESKRVDNIEIKQKIKNDLNEMLRIIIIARPEIRNTQLARMIKMIK